MQRWICKNRQLCALCSKSAPAIICLCFGTFRWLLWFCLILPLFSASRLFCCSRRCRASPAHQMPSSSCPTFVKGLSVSPGNERKHQNEWVEKHNESRRHYKGGFEINTVSLSEHLYPVKKLLCPDHSANLGFELDIQIIVTSLQAATELLWYL